MFNHLTTCLIPRLFGRLLKRLFNLLFNHLLHYFLHGTFGHLGGGVVQLAYFLMMMNIWPAFFNDDESAW